MNVEIKEIGVRATLERVKAIVARKDRAEQLIMAVIADLQTEEVLDPRWGEAIKTDIEKAFLLLGAKVAQGTVATVKELRKEEQQYIKCVGPACRHPGWCDPEHGCVLEEENLNAPQ